MSVLMNYANIMTQNQRILQNSIIAKWAMITFPFIWVSRPSPTSDWAIFCWQNLKQGS